MKNTIFTRFLFALSLFLTGSYNLFANHIVGADLSYSWVSGNIYKIRLTLYGDCGSPVGGSTTFYDLPGYNPKICVYNGSTSVGSLNLTPVTAESNIEITPVCPDSLGHTKCTSLSFVTEGIKKYVYEGNYTVSGPSHYWRFLYLGYNNSTSISGRALSITNLSSSPVTIIQLTDTLDNTWHNNTSPLLTVVPTPFFPNLTADNYNPGAVDPDTDSLMFALVPALNGSGSTSCVSSGSATYMGFAWPGQPITATTPLNVNPGMFSLNPYTGQIAFFPNAIQRSVVVYNIREFRNDTFIGTSQREMTFLTLTAPNVPPKPGTLTASNGTVDDSTHFHICQGAGAFCLTLTPSNVLDTTRHLTCTASGIGGTGITFAVMANGTNHPTVNICGNASTMAAGDYVCYLTITDDNCPITGSTTVAYTIRVLPAPSVSYSIVAPATCVGKATIHVLPGGSGKPWTVKMSDPSLTPPTDTFQTWVDSVGFDYLIAPGAYFLTIFTSVSNECHTTIPVSIPRPAINPTTASVNPTYCGGNDGYITINSLVPTGVDTVRFDYNSVPQPMEVLVASPGGSANINSLYAGTYTNITVAYGYCISPPLGPIVLTNPPFTWSNLTYSNPTKCGFCDGQVVVHGLHPGQYDSVFYNFNGAPTSVYNFVGADSTVTIPALCEGAYTSFVAHTASGACITPPLGPLSLIAPPIKAIFDTLPIKYGCHGDTVRFVNSSTHGPVDSIQYYTWFFGDGTTSNEVNPVHVYTNSAIDTVFTIRLVMTNTKCVDSTKMTITLRNYIDANFTITPNDYLCQGKPLTLDNISTGGNPNTNVALQYKWIYADGNVSNNASASHTHSFANTGTYRITLIASNMITCYDTAYATIQVDSISGISLLLTDSVICRGQAIAFTGLYSAIGNGRNDSLVSFNFGNGLVMLNKNPVLYAFDQAGSFDVKVQSYYRSCPDTTITRKVRVFDQPDIYLGPDTSICLGSTPIALTDKFNAATQRAHWMWNNDPTASGPSMVVTKSGLYAATVTIDGCSSSDTVWVANDCYVSIPNVFTPNEDGVNDYFFPRQLLARGMTSFSMNIYNRWGQLIYETTAIDGRGWDGMMNNVPQPYGVYVYVIDVKFKDGQIEHHQGNVTLMR